MNNRELENALEAIAGGDPTDAELQMALVELCGRGLLTCTKGVPGKHGARYALAWLPLDNPEQYSPEVRERHARNMARFNVEENP